MHRSLPLVTRRNTEEERVKLVAQAILSTRLTQSDNDKLQNMPGTNFEEDTFISDYRIRAELTRETSLSPTLVDCCPNGCIAFTGRYVNESYCILCKRPRWKTVSMLVWETLSFYSDSLAAYRRLATSVRHCKLSHTSHQFLASGRCGGTKK